MRLGARQPQQREELGGCRVVENGPRPPPVEALDLGERLLARVVDHLGPEAEINRSVEAGSGGY